MSEETRRRVAARESFRLLRGMAGEPLPEHLRLGRYSEGVERIRDEDRRVQLGRFSTGMERAGGGERVGRVGRFSRGAERRSGAPAGERVGRYCDTVSPGT